MIFCAILAALITVCIAYFSKYKLSLLSFIGYLCISYILIFFVVHILLLPLTTLEYKTADIKDSYILTTIQDDEYIYTDTNSEGRLCYNYFYHDDETDSILSDTIESQHTQIYIISSPELPRLLCYKPTYKNKVIKFLFKTPWWAYNHYEIYVPEGGMIVK